MEEGHMSWLEYMTVVAAPHSKRNARLWFRYLRKYIDNCGTVFSKQDVDDLCKNESLTPFQRVSLKAAFKEDSPTRQYIIGLNRKANRNILQLLRERHELDTNEQ